MDAKNREGESPLLTASARGFVDIVECLVEHGAELETTDKVTRAQPDSFWHILLLLLRVFVRGLTNRSHHLCRSQTLTRLCLCLQEGHTALHLAVRRCQVEVVRCLLRHRCQVDQQDRHGNTPLHIACKDGNLPVVMAICNAKASLDLPNKVSASTSPQTARIRSLRRSQAALRGLVVSHSFQTQLSS